MTEHDFTRELELTQNPDMRLIRHMFSTINNSVLELSSDVKKNSDKTDEVRIKVEKLDTRFDSFREEVFRHFATCPVDDLREHTGQIDIELERLKAKKQAPGSSDKISRIPSPASREKTIQLLIVLAIVVLSGGAVAAQLLN